MFQFKKHRAAVIAGLVSLAALTACGSGEGADDGADGKDEFVIAAVVPMTGALAVPGNDILAGIKTQIDLINEEGGILGQQVRLEVKDSASDPQQAVSAMRALLADPSKVDAVIPEITGTTNAAVLPIVTQSKIISVTTAAQPPNGDPENRPYNFSIVTTPETQVAAALAAARKVSDTDKLGLSVRQDATGDEVVKQFEAQAADFGFEIVGTERLAVDGKDFTAQLQNLRASGAEIVSGNMLGTMLGVFAQGLENLGWDVPVVGDAGFSNAPLNEIIPASVQPQIKYAGYMASTRVGGELSDAQQGFIDALATSGHKVSAYGTAAGGADIVLTIKYAFDKAGEVDQDKALAALESMQGDPAAEELDWKFLLGTGPQYSEGVHDTSNLDPAGKFAINVIDEYTDGIHEGEPLD
jgi:branched-chain amino acid transport system substrate-binding protein